MGFLAWIGVSLLGIATTFVGVDYALDGEIDASKEFIAKGAVSAFEQLISVLPDSEGLPAIFDTAVVALGSNLAFVNLFLPLDHIVTIISLFVVIQSVFIVWKFTYFIYSAVRGIPYIKNDSLDFSPSDTSVNIPVHNSGGHSYSRSHW